MLPLSDCGRNCAGGANQFCQSSAIISTVCLCTSDFVLGSGSHTARRGMAPHSRRDPCLLLLYHSVVAPSVFAGLWVLPGINPQAVHGHREFQALQCALTRHETACESKVKTTTTTTLQLCCRGWYPQCKLCRRLRSFRRCCSGTCRHQECL